MGLFDIFKRRKPPELLHPVFGRIVYVDEGIWEMGKVFFAPIKKEVEVIINAGPEGPGQPHLQFLAELEQRWPSLLAAWEPLLRAALVDWIENPESGDIWKRVEVESIEIFPGLKPAQQWDFMFWCQEAGHWPIFTMLDWTPQSCGIDG
jgi:hypothetical protein